MKRILFNVILLMFFGNVFAQDIVWSNCPDFDTEEYCMNLRTDIALINIKVNLPTNMENTAWKVQFSTSTYYEFIEFWNFRTITETNATHEYSYSLPVNSSTNTYVFAVYLFDEAGYHRATSNTMTFNLCEPYTSARLSANNHDNFDIDKNTKSIDFGSILFSNEERNIDFNVFPNPFEEDFTIQYSAIKGENIEFEIMDIAGNLIDKTEIQHRSKGVFYKKFNNLTLPKGVYFCRIESGENSDIIKLLKTR